MAKKEKQQKVIESVSLKDPNQVIELPRIGMVVNKDNLTIKRYQKLIAIHDGFKDFFNVKLTNKQEDEQSEVHP